MAIRERESATKPQKWRDRIKPWKVMEPSPLPAGAPREKARTTIVGTGLVGLALAIDLGQRGHDVIVLGRFDFIPAGSKAICFSKRSLDILDRLGVGENAAQRGVGWNVGKVFWKDEREPIYQFDMLPVKNQKMPGFINLQQYLLEEIMLDRLAGMANVDIRWGHDVTNVDVHSNGAIASISSDAGDYQIDTEWLLACDGSKSSIREMMNLDFDGRVFEDNFLIADIKMKDDHPSERWFWFDPPFHPGQSVLMHKQPDDVWRIDFQLGWEIDRQACIQPENVDPKIRAMLGEDVEYEQEWYSVYTFQCRRMSRFVHGHVIFAGDSAHLVSPFGARGCNGGFADVDNLSWKLDLVLKGKAGADLLETYNSEAIITADENILNSSRSTDFLTPKSKDSVAFRDAVLELAADYPFARAFVNSGRLSTAVAYPDSPLNTPDSDEWTGGISPGFPALDAQLGSGWLLENLGQDFVLLCNGAPQWRVENLIICDVSDAQEGELAIERFALEPGAAYLIRPDQYVAARFKSPDKSSVIRALNRACGKELS